MTVESAVPSPVAYTTKRRREFFRIFAKVVNSKTETGVPMNSGEKDSRMRTTVQSMYLFSSLVILNRYNAFKDQKWELRQIQSCVSEL